MIKRAFDLISSGMGLIVLFPFFVVLGISIKISSRGPVFFKQMRVGRAGCTFNIFKFRTMVIDAEVKGLQITVGGRDPRITKIGYYLRKYKLDELPQLINVFAGDMSFVGPRPEVPKYVALYTDEQKKVLRVRPGITDVASIEYRNENEMLSGCDDPEKVYIEEIMPAKLIMNLQYLSNATTSSDFKLIIKTIWKVVRI